MLGNKNRKIKKTLLKECGPRELNALCEVCLNITKGNVPMKPSQKKKLCQYKSILRLLADKKVSPKTKLSHLKKPQSGGFLPILAALIPSVIGAITSAFQS